MRPGPQPWTLGPVLRHQSWVSRGDDTVLNAPAVWRAYHDVVIVPEVNGPIPGSSYQPFRLHSDLAAFLVNPHIHHVMHLRVRWLALSEPRGNGGKAFVVAVWPS